MAANRKSTAAPAADEESGAFTAEERTAMKERAQEVRSARRRTGKAASTDPGAEVLAKIAELTGDDRAIAERLHAIVGEVAPGLTPRTWYGMPAYARDGKVVCFFQPASKFKARYGTLGFNDDARLDDGEMWPTAFAITALTDAVETRIREVVARAAG